MANYYRRKNGTYCVRVSNGMKNGRQELVGATYKPPAGATKAMIEKGVREFAALFEAAVHNGLYVPGSNPKSVKNSFGMTVESFIMDTYFSRASVKYSPNTVRFYHMVCEQFIIPTYGDIRLHDIAPYHMQGFINGLSAPESRSDSNNTEPLSPSTVKRYATVFSSVMSEACKAGFISSHPFKNAVFDYPKQRRATVDVYDEDEVRRFVDGLQNEPLQTQGILLSALMLGLRRAEIVALKWEDVDFVKGSVRISRSAYKVKGKDQGEKAPKSQKSVRTVFFSGDYRDLLLKISEEQGGKRKGYIFSDGNGKMISLYAPTEICADFERRCGIRHLKLHGLRHTCASLMVSNGVDPETVKSMLGHDSLRTTDIYLHPYERNMKQAADLIGNLMKGENAHESENIASNS